MDILQELAIKTFDTAQLHETILTHLDMKTLLLAQRVNTEWRDTIASSSKLQKMLFFSPVKAFAEAVTLNMVDGHTLVNECRREVLLPNFLWLDLDPKSEQALNNRQASGTSAWEFSSNFRRVSCEICHHSGVGKLRGSACS